MQQSKFQNNLVKQTNKKQKIQEKSSTSQEEAVCIRIKNLDQQIFETVEDIYIPQSIEPVKKQSIWEEYRKEQDILPDKLMKTLKDNDCQELEKLIKVCNQDINLYTYIDNWSLLHVACQYATQHIVQLLLKFSINVEAETMMKRRPIHIATLRNNYQIVKLLLQKNIDINCCDEDFCTPLHYAVSYGYTQIIKLIISKYSNTVNLYIKNNKKMTIIDCCRDRHLLKIFQQINCIDQCWKYQKRYYLTQDKQMIKITSRQDHIQKFLCYRQRERFNNNIYCYNKINNNIEDIHNQTKTTNINTNNNNNNNNSNNFLNNNFNYNIQLKKSESVSTSRLLNRSTKMSLLMKQSLATIQDYLMYQQIESLNNYQKLRKLGQGAFGKVYLVRRKRTSKMYALKQIGKDQIIKNKLKKYMYMERQILLKLKNTFIVHAHSFFQNSDNLFIVMEACLGGDFQKIIRRSGKIQEKMVKLYAAEVVLALGYLHSQNIIFRDLKPANVLLDVDGHIKITDFGLAKQANISYSFLGSKAYLAPQMLLSDNKEHNMTIDWYLLGVFIYELLVGVPPFYHRDQYQLFRNIKQNPPNIPPWVSSQCKHILIRLLQKNPNKRLGHHQGMKQIQKHQWFKDIDWIKIQNKSIVMPKPNINTAQLRQKLYVDQQQHDIEINNKKIFKNWDYYEIPK